MRTFLISRKIRVIVEGVESWTDVKSDVPQGSVMGPLLYLLFVNDLSDIVINEIKMFADDTKIWGPEKTVEDGRSFLFRMTSTNSANDHRNGNYNTTWTSVKPCMLAAH